MMLSFLRDIVLEIIVIIITFLQWHKGSISTLLLVEFIAEKTIWLVISTCKWWTILKWYMQLQREAKIRRFTKIAQKSIANIVNVSGRIGRSLNDECFSLAIVRREKYVSLLNLNRISDPGKLFNKINFDLRISKSLTNSVTNNNSHDSNDLSTNDLSVAEKAMKILGITAEDVMDACARIQERSYWSEQDVTAKTPEAMEEKVTQFSLEEDSKKIDNALKKQKNNIVKTAECTLIKKDIMRNSQIEINDRKNKKKINNALKSKETIIDITVDYNLMKNVVMQNPQIDKTKEKDKNKINKKEQILIDEKQDVSSTKSEDVISDELNNCVKSTESYNNGILYKLQKEELKKKKKKEEIEILTRMEHCPLSSAQCKNARNIEAKPCASLVRKLKAKLQPISINQKEKWLNQLDRRKYSYRVKLIPTGSDANKKNSRTSLCACHHTLKKNTDALRNGEYSRSTYINNKNVNIMKKQQKHNIDRKEFRRVVSIVNMYKDKINKCDSTFKYSEAYRLKKQIQKSEEFSTKQMISWGSISLAQTVRPSGYTRNIVAINESPGICQNIQTECCDESNDSLNTQYRLKRKVQSRYSISPRSTYNASIIEKNYARSEKCKTKILEVHNDLTLLESKKGMKARRHNLSSNGKLSNEEREVIELRALKAFNELTLLEDKKKLEAKKNRDLSLNYEQLTGESKVSEIKVFNSCNNLTLLEEQKEMDAIRKYNLSSNCKQSIEDSNSLKVCNKYTLLKDKKEMKTEEKHDSLKYETSKRYEKNVETSTSVSNHLSEVNREEISILSSETRRNANSNSELNERYARQAYMSLNLREITRNIEWTIHPRGIILTNKNLHRQFLEDERFRESLQRDIVDNNTASTLHSAFFFKPEIVTRIFRRVQTRIGESFPSFPTFLREDNTEFVCQMNNETVIQWDRDSSSFNFDLERIMADQSNLENSSFPDVNSNLVAEEENRDLFIIFIDQGQANSHETETAIENSTVAGSQENARSSMENIETTNILLMCILRDFGIEMSEENVHDVTSSAEQVEEYRNISNIVVKNTDFQSSNFSANDTNEEEDNRHDAIPLHQQILHSNDNCLNDIDITSSVNLLKHKKSYNLPDKTYINAINISSEKIYENNSSLKDADNNTASQLSCSNNNQLINNNNQFDTLINKNEKSIFNHISGNASQLSFSGSWSSNDEEELQRLMQLSNSEATLENKKKESVKNLETIKKNYDTIPQSENVKTLNLLETMAQDSTRNEDKDTDIYKKINISSTHKFCSMNQDEKLQQVDSFYSMYERNNDRTETPVSFGDGSLMEEFSNFSTVLLKTSSNVSIKDSAHF